MSRVWGLIIEPVLVFYGMDTPSLGRDTTPLSAGLRFPRDAADQESAASMAHRRAKYDAALAQVPDSEPDEHDRL